MPIYCPIDIPRISDDEIRRIDYQVMEHAFATHNELGRLADETVFHHRLLHRLHLAGLDAMIEVPIELSFRTVSLSQAVDLVVAGKVIYELKTVVAFLPAHKSQLRVLVHDRYDSRETGELQNKICRIEIRQYNTYGGSTTAV